MSTKAEQLALLQKKLSMTKTKTGKAVLEKKIDKLKSEMGSSTKAKKDVTEAKKKVSQMSIAELKKKPEFSFLKGMNKGKIEDDQKRVAKPKGWRFKGKGKYRKPTKAEIVAGKKRGNVYYEARNRRSDVSRIVRLKTGGGVGESKSYLHLYKLTSPNGQYRVEVYDGEAMTPKEALEKMRISLKGLKSYKYVGASSDSANYKKWYDKKSIGYSDTEAWDEVFGNQKYANGGGVGDEISLAIKYGKMLNDLNKEKQFNKKIELNSVLKNFEKQNEISIDSNNVISVKGNKVAYIDKINAKTGQPKTNWDIKKYAKGGKLSKYKYVPNRDINEMEINKRGKSVDVDGADILDGVYIKKGKYATGGDLFTGEPHRNETMRNGGKVEEYPELRKISNRIADETAEKINNSVKNVSSKMPYKAQWVLEEVVKDLESRI